MKYLCLSCLIWCANLDSFCQSKSTTDAPEKLKQVLMNYFDGIKNNDRKKMQEATTNDVVIYEEGKIWTTNDSVFKEMDRISPYNAEFKFDNFKINVDNNSGHMSYIELAQFTVRDTVKFNLNYIGSAAFRKENGKWKMSFLHSTRKFAPRKKN